MQFDGILRLAVAAGGLMVLLCTPPPPLSTIPGPRALPLVAQLSENVPDFQGFGDLTLARNGEVNRLYLTVIKHGAQFQALLQSPFGQTLATLEADQDTARIALGDSLYTHPRNQPLPQLSDFLHFSFTFDDLARILLGKLPDENLLSVPPDTLFTRRGLVHYVWRGDTMQAEITASRSKLKLKSVRLAYSQPVPQQLVLSSFRTCFAHEIHFRLDEKNYFTVNYERIKAGCR
jgi:hypothetical protein